MVCEEIKLPFLVIMEENKDDLDGIECHITILPSPNMVSVAAVIEADFLLHFPFRHRSLINVDCSDTLKFKWALNFVQSDSTVLLGFPYNSWHKILKTSQLIVSITH